MATAFPHLCAYDLLLIDADIAHIRLAIEREFDSRFRQPVLPRLYWRERLLGIVSAFDLLPQQCSAIDELLRRLDRYEHTER
ncbi:hypothetical protein [Caballeronia terrestris]|uniref:hypothetical protein n=1 Tax=Caballeronia terrestris TaxID=1226301 RepID=UPI001F1B9718|nr:hypothetical protein [Caballeronia terrestris]